MGRSRYAGNKVLDGSHYGTWNDPTRKDQFGPDILDGVQCVDHVIVFGERLDILSHRYYGDSELWWIIALANRIKDPFGIQPGDLLRVPLDARNLMDKVSK